MGKVNVVNEIERHKVGKPSETKESQERQNKRGMFRS